MYVNNSGVFYGDTTQNIETVFTKHFHNQRLHLLVISIVKAQLPMQDLLPKMRQIFPYYHTNGP